MIDAHEYNGFNSSNEGETFVCHSFCWLGGEPLVDVLGARWEYMIVNPREVVTIILESYVPYEQIEEAFVESGLIEYVHPQDANVNQNPFLIDRAEESQAETGKLPNFVTVDFYSIGAVLEAVNMLNGVD